MKHILSVSLGDSDRNSKLIENFAGQSFILERLGTNGSKKLALDLIRENDGKVSAFGLGGTDIYIYAGDKRYVLQESLQFLRMAKKSPLVDGSGLKNTLERRILQLLQLEYNINFTNKKILLVCAVDRFGLAEAIVESGMEFTFGDLIYGLGINYPIKTMSGLKRLANFILPVISKLPVSWFYPTGKAQQKQNSCRTEYFFQHDIIAGDFHFIKKFMPRTENSLLNKIIITNTVTAEDRLILKVLGVKILVTTTPQIQGRSFGTNVIEALLVALADKDNKKLSSAEYEAMIAKLQIKPHVEIF